MIQLTSKYAVRALLTLSIGLLLLTGLLASGLFKASGSGGPEQQVTVQASGRGTPLLNLQDGREVATEYRGEPALTASLRSGLARPRALAAEDLDGDSAPDVLAGYSNNGSGIVSVQHGNTDAFAPKDDSVFRRVQQGENPGSLTPVAELYETPEAVDFLAAGDFNLDGRKDVLTAARGGGLYLLAGDEEAHLRPAERVALAGQVTTFATGEFGRADGKTEVAVGTIGANGPALFIYSVGAGGLTDVVASYALPAEAKAIGFGRLDDDPFMDVAVATGNSVEIIHGSGLLGGAGSRARVEQVDLSFTAQSLALGDFVWDRDHKTEIAVLAQDGTLHMLEQGQLDTRPFSEQEQAARVALRGRTENRQSVQEIDAAPSWQPDRAPSWQVSQEIGATSAPTDQISSQGQLIRSHVSFQDTDELLVLDGAASQLRIVQENEGLGGRDARSASISTTSLSGVGEMSSVSLDVASAPAAVLALPPKINGERNMVVLQSSAPQVSTVAITPTATVTVNSTTDVIHNPGCSTTGTGTCSLRDAVIFSNANPGTTISINAGTYQLTLPAGASEAGSCQSPTIGDLDFSKTTTITGAGAATTIIQQTQPNDRVICLDLAGTGNVSYSISGVTITGGRERYGIGGGGIVGGQIGDNLTLTNVVISNNQADTSLCTPTPSSCTNSGGGGVNIFGGSMTITGSTIGGNNAPGSSQTDTTLANSTTGSGGGLTYGPGSAYVNNATGTLTINGNTVIQKNTAGSTAGGGGGAELTTINLGTGSFSIGPATITGNSATAGNGGGILIESLNLTLANTTVSSNTAPAAGHYGGGVYLSGGSLTFSSSSSFSSNTANVTASNAIAVNSGGAGGGVTVNGTGNNINDNVDILGNGDWTNATGSSVTFATLTLEACSGCPTPRGIFTANNSTTNATNVNMAGGTFNGNTGTLSISNNLNLTGSGSTFNASSGQTTISGNYTQSTGTFNGSSGTVNLAGNFAFSAGTFNANTNTFNFNGSGAQSIGSSAVTFNNLTVNKSAGTLTLNNNISVAGNLSVSAGTFDLQSFTANRTAAGGTLTVSNGATLKIGGTNSLPTNYSTHSIGATSTIEYSGTSQTIAVPNSSQSYGNLVTSGSGTKTLAGNITVATGLTIGSGTVLAGGTNTLNIQGNWTNNAGASGFTSTGAGVVNFNGTGAQALNGQTNFNILTINKSAGTLTLGANISTAGNFNLTAGTFDAGANTINVGGNWNNTGTFTPSTSTVNFNGSGAQAINNTTTFNNLTVNKSAGTLTLAANVTVNSDLTVSAGTFDLGSFTANRAATGGTMTVSDGATVNIGGTNSLPANYATYTFGPASTINFNGSNQNVPGATYGNLTISSSGTKTLLGTTTIAGNFLLSGGAFDANANTINIGGNWTVNTGATFLPSLSTVNFNGTTAGQAINGTATTQSFYDLSVNKSGQTLSIGGSTTTLNVGGNLLVNAGTFAQSASALNVTGNLTVNSGAGFTKASGGQALTFNGAGQSWTDNNATSQDFGNVVIGGTNNVVTAGGNLKATALTVNGSDTFFLNGKTFAFTAAAAATNNGIIQLVGNETLTNVNNLGTSAGTVEYVGDGTAGPFTLKDFGATDYFNLSINDTHATKATFNVGSNLDINGNLLLTSGTLNGGSSVISLKGLFTNSGGTFAPATGTFAFNGNNNTQTIPAGTSFNNLTINHSGTGGVALGGIATVDGTLTLTGGALSIGANTLTLNGNISTTSGSLTGGSTSNLVFGGTGASTTLPAVAGGLNNLTLNRAAGLQLGADLTVGGTLALTSGDLNTGAFTLIQPITAPASQGTGDVIGSVKRSNAPSAIPASTAMTFGNPNNIITFDAAGTNPTDITVTLAKSAPTSFTTAVQRTYNITPNGGSGYSATLRLHYLDSELNGNDENTMTLWRFNSTRNAWEFRPVSARDTTNDWVESAGVTQFSPWTFNSTFVPTASPVSISGRVTNSAGAPVGGVVVQLSGSAAGRTITDEAGNYKFENLSSEGFYTVQPQRANYSFSPATLSFSLVADKTNAVFTATASASQTSNPLDTDLFFVRQHYLDFLGREPDAGGLDYWASEIEKCGTDPDCLTSRRIGVSAAFFMESEFRKTGGFVYGLYKGGFGRQVRYTEFVSDRQQVIDGPNLDQNKAALADAFVTRPEFLNKYGSATTADSFVDALLANIRQTSGADLSGQRAALIDRYNSGASQSQSRALVLRDAVESAAFNQAEYNPSFVLMQYFGYLRRDPEPEGFDFWLNVLNNREPNNYRGMVCSFITSAEYQQRFASVVPHSNRECSR